MTLLCESKNTKEEVILSFIIPLIEFIDSVKMKGLANCIFPSNSNLQTVLDLII